MDDVAERARFAADFLDELLSRIEGLSARLGSLEASGGLTPELEAEIRAGVDRMRVLLPAVRESVDPSNAPLLRIMRLVKAKASELRASGMAVDEIRAMFGDLVTRTADALPAEQRQLFGPMVLEALDEVLVAASG